MGKITNLIFIAVLVSVVLLGGCIYTNDMKGIVSPGQANDSQANYTNKTIDANDKIRGVTGKTLEEECLPYALFNFSATRLCSINPDTGKNQYYCEPRAGKDKVAIVVAKGGIYDSPAMDSQILAYYASVKKDLGIESASLRKFEGKSMDELDIFMDGLYLDDDVGYVVFVGDDLPLANVTKDDMESLADMYDKLDIVQRNFTMLTCPDMAISYIPVPEDYSDSDKAAFVMKVLETYTGYHNDFANLASKYQDSVLEITDITFGTINLGYNMTIVNVHNNEYSKVLEEMKEKHKILYLSVHGSPASVGMGLYGPNQTTPPDGSDPYYTTLDEYSEFADMYGAPALFVDSGACQAITIKDFGMIGFSPCCWPQIYIDSGVWVYYSISNGHDVEEDISDGGMIGLAIRKNVVSQFFVYGDILAHIK